MLLFPKGKGQFAQTPVCMSGNYGKWLSASRFWKGEDGIVDLTSLNAVSSTKEATEDVPCGSDTSPWLVLEKEVFLYQLVQGKVD